MLATSQRALTNPARCAKSYDPRRGLAPVQRCQPAARSGRMNLGLGSFRRPAQRSGASTKAKNSISDGVWENQRFYYAFGWNAPIPSLDGPGYWTNCVDGTAVPDEVNPFATSETEELQEGEQALQWVVEVTPATDSQGWMYGSHFQTLNYRREGGRACRRPADFVRRRKWLQQPVASTPPSAQHASTSGTRGVVASQGGRQRATSFVSRSDAMHVTPASAAKADDTRRTNFRMSAGTAAKAFFSMLQDAAKRRKGGLMSIPWDPLAWGSVYSMHSAWLTNTQSLLLSHRLRSAPQDLEHAMHAMHDAIASTRSHSGMQPDALSKELVDDMHGAVDFARAAYGYAFLSGGLSSIPRYLHMQTLQRSTFDVIAGVSAEENTLAFCAVADVAIGDVVLAEWHNTTYRPCHVLAIDHTRRRIVLTIRGSLELGDLLTDLHAKPIAVKLPIVSGGDLAQCHVHEGMLRAAAYVHCNTADALVEASGRFPDWPLFVTGHSLGGGVAALVAVLLRQQGGAPERLQENGITCMTIGTGSSMSAELAAACKDYVTSLVLANDVVPRLSYHTVEYLLDELIRKSPALNFAESVRTSVALTFAPFTTAGRAAAADAAAAAAGGEAASGYAASGGGAAAARSDTDRASPGTPLRGAPSEAIQLAEMPSGAGFGSLDLTPSASRPLQHPRASTGFSGTISSHRTPNTSPPQAHPTSSATLRSTTDFNSAVSSGAPLEASFRSVAPSATATAGVERAARAAGAAGRAGVFPSDEITAYPSPSDELRDPLPSTSFDTAHSDGSGGTSGGANAQQGDNNHTEGVGDRIDSSGSGPSFADEMDRFWGQVQIHEARSAVMYSDGMATGTPPQSPPRDSSADTSMWRKFLAPVEGILGTAPQDNPPATPPNPFTPEAIRVLAEKSRREKEQAERERQAHAQARAEEPPPGAPLRDVSVADPLRYLEESGISRSRGSSVSGEAAADTNVQGANAFALTPGAFASGTFSSAGESNINLNSNKSNKRNSAGLNSHSVRSDAPGQRAASVGATNASQVQAIDDSVLHQADAGHVAAEASSAAPPPLYPPGRVLWLIPLKAAGQAGSPPKDGGPESDSAGAGVSGAAAAGAAAAGAAGAGPAAAATAGTAAAAAATAAAPSTPPRAASAARSDAAGTGSGTNSTEIVSTTLLPSQPHRLATQDVLQAAYSSHRESPSPPQNESTPAPAAVSHEPPSPQEAPFSTPIATPYPSNPLESSIEDLPSPVSNNPVQSGSNSSFQKPHPKESQNEAQSPPQSPPQRSYGETNSHVSAPQAFANPASETLAHAPKRKSSSFGPTVSDNGHANTCSPAGVELEERRQASSAEHLKLETHGQQHSGIHAPSNAQNIPEHAQNAADGASPEDARISESLATQSLAQGSNQNQPPDRSKFIQLASETLMSASADDAVRSSQYEGEELDFAVDEFGSPRQSSGPSQQLPLSGVISDKGADIAAGAFAAGLVDGDAPVEGAWGVIEDGDSSPAGKGGWDAAPKWLKRLVMRQPSSQMDDELLPHLQASPQDAPAKGEQEETMNAEPDVPVDSHPVALSSGTLTAENSPNGHLSGERLSTGDAFTTGGTGEAAQANGERSTEFVIERVLSDRGTTSTVAQSSDEEPSEDPRSTELATEVAVIDMTDRRDVFNYLTLCTDMVQDHLPDQYTKAIALIVKESKEKAHKKAGT